MRKGLNTGGSLKVVVIIVLSIICIVTLYQYNDTKNRVLDLESEEAQCRQKKESLSAQLQVVYEHRSRLERSLQKEKDEHINANEKCEADLKLMKQKHADDKHESEARFKALQQQCKLSQTKHEDLEQLHSNLQQQLNQLKDEKLKAEMKVDEEASKSLAKEKLLQDEIANLRTINSNLQHGLEQLQNSEVSRLKALNSNIGDTGLNKLGGAPNVQLSQAANVGNSQHSVIQPNAPGTNSDAVVGADSPSASLNKNPVGQPDLNKPLPPFHQISSSLDQQAGAADALATSSAAAKPTTTTTPGRGSKENKEPDAVGQIPLPKDERQIRAAQLGIHDTGRKEEVAQAEQVALPRNPAAILEEEKNAAPPRHQFGEGGAPAPPLQHFQNALERNLGHLPGRANLADPNALQPPAAAVPNQVAPPVGQKEFAPKGGEKQINNDREEDKPGAYGPADDGEIQAGKGESNAAKEKNDDFDNAEI